MSVRTWDAGNSQNLALFIMVLFWTLLILLAIGRTDWQWNPPTIAGLVFVIGILIIHLGYVLHQNQNEGEGKGGR